MTTPMEKVLVTGGAGLIGIHVCRELLRRGIRPHLYDLPEQIARARGYLPEGAVAIGGSILDRAMLRDAIQGCQGVIHLAAYLGVRRTETNKLRCLHINIDGTQNIMECAVQDRVSRLVFASSSEVYGEPAANPVDESVPTQGKTIYAVTKLAGEEMCKAYAQRYPFLQYTILRYFNTFGPHQVAQFVIPKFIRNVMQDKPPVIYGGGRQLRSYCYVEDTAWATVEALMREDTRHAVINVGNDRNRVSLTELARTIIRLAGKEADLEPVFQGRFANTDREALREVYTRYCDIARARELLDFNPRFSLEQGLQRVIEHGVFHPRWDGADLDYTLDDWLIWQRGQEEVQV